MVKTVYVCDRCNKEYNGDDGYNLPNSSRYSFKMHASIGCLQYGFVSTLDGTEYTKDHAHIENSSYDLCPSCAKLLVRFLSGPDTVVN